MTLPISDAQRLVNIIDGRVARTIGKGTVMQHTFGTVEAVVNTSATVFIGGDVNASGGFRIPAGLTVEAGDTVRVIIDPRGMRWIEEVIPGPSTTFPAASIDPVRGRLLLGDGTVAPVVGASLQIPRMDASGTVLEWVDLPAPPTVPDPASTVQSETSFGTSSSVGTSPDYARADHKHGNPALPTDPSFTTVTASGAIDGGTLKRAGNSLTPVYEKPTGPAATSSLTLATSSADIAGCTKTYTPAVDETVLVIATVDVAASATGSGTTVIDLVVDGVVQNGQGLFGNTQNDLGRATIGQHWIVDLTGGSSHTLKLQARKTSAGGTVVINITHTHFTVLRFGATA